MGIVKFGATQLNIAEVPDGHMIVSEASFQALRSFENNYLGLKAYIPLEVMSDLTKLPTLLEKGSRYDALSQKNSDISTKLSDAETKLQAVKNLPEGFTLEKWNTDRAREKSDIRSQQMKELHKKTEDYAGEKFKIKIPEIDSRFIDKAKVDALDPTAADATQKYLDILNEGHTEQQKFLQTSGQSPITEPAQQHSAPQAVRQGDGPKDMVSETGVHVAHL